VQLLPGRSDAVQVDLGDEFLFLFLTVNLDPRTTSFLVTVPWRGDPMSTTIAPQVASTTHTAFAALAASVIAIVLAVVLPLALHTTKTVFVKATTPTTSTNAPAPVSHAQLLRESHGG
jgi:hypothetical protein